MIIIGADAMASDDYEATIYYAKMLAKQYGFIQDGWNGYNILQRAASRVGGLDIGFVPGAGGLATAEILRQSKVIFLMGADEVNLSAINPNAFIVYIGHHGDRIAAMADVILPGAAYTEKNATYVNLEGRVQTTQLAVFPPNLAQEDWRLIVQLAQALGVKLPYAKLQDIRSKMGQISPVFKGDVMLHKTEFPMQEGKKKDFSKDFMVNYVTNYYMTDPISRNSRTMAKCTAEIKKKVA